MSILKVVPHDPRWKDLFETEARLLDVALGENIVAAYHIGSTAIPSIYAKPVIDFLVEVRDLDRVELQNAAMESLGYEALGEFGMTGRRYFRKDDENENRTHQIHVFESGSPDLERHLAFRDYMIAHPDAAKKYSDLKRDLAAEFPNDPEAYMDGKDGFIKEMDSKATEWQAARLQ